MAQSRNHFAHGRRVKLDDAQQDSTHDPLPSSQPADGGRILVDPALGFDGVTAYPIDGVGNNPSDPTLGAANTDEVRLAPANFAPNTTDTPVSGPNPRDISNAIFATSQDEDPGGRSAYMYAFGQFIDHDIDLNNVQTAAADGSNVLHFTIPEGDPALPSGSEISITRGEVDPANGNAINAVTQFSICRRCTARMPPPLPACAIRTARSGPPRVSICRSTMASMSEAMSVPRRTLTSRQSTCCSCANTITGLASCILKIQV